MKKQIVSALAALLFSSALYAIDLPRSGTVLESMNSGGYTYIKLKEKEETFWLAVKQTSVEKGQRFLFHEQMWMKNFTSKTLNRTFDKLLFAKSATKAKAQKAPSEPKKAWEMPMEKQEALAVPDSSKGAIAKILKQKDSLKDKSVTVEGKVVKVSRGIMNTSWVHIEDDYRNKLIFRATKESVEVGQSVKAQGTLNTNVDYGYGYAYEAIVVDSTFTKL